MATPAARSDDNASTCSRSRHCMLAAPAVGFAVALAFLAVVALGAAAFRPLQAKSERMPERLPAGIGGLREAGQSTIRGLTIGPIESTLQDGRGYGTPTFDQTLGVVDELGGNWISLTVFGRVWDTSSAGVSLDFERPFGETRQNVLRSVEAAHARGLRVMLVPHLWVESGQWRAEMQPGSDARWQQWSRSYQRFVVAWAELAEEADVDLFAVGVELRSWVTTPRAESFFDIIAAVRGKYSGLLTYAANWDDVEDTVILGQLDVIGINAFYPLHWEDNASREQLLAGGERVAQQVGELAARYSKPVIFTEFGYTTRKNTAIKPWLWPEELGKVEVSQEEQAEAYAALLASMVDVPGFGGVFVWRLYADVADMSQEPDWGFSPYNKQAEKVLRDAFAAEWWGDVKSLGRVHHRP